jgi:C-terminal processing protease CtpA/Prc
MGLLAGQAVLSAEADQAPEFKEVYDLIRQHLSGISEGDLDRTAAQALVSALGPKVTLVTNSADAAASATVPLVSKSNVFEGNLAYLRVGRVGDGLAKALRGAYEHMDGTNQLKGVVLDLRYTDGRDYAAAAAAVDLFVAKDRPLLNWGDGVARSKEKTDAIRVPVAVLVNGQTTGAAEALAAVLRETGAGLILGSRTAGQAMVAEAYPLKDGARLRIATAPVELGNGTALPAEGVKPDIIVEVSARDEHVYFADAFKDISRTNMGEQDLNLTNQVGSTTIRTNRRSHFNEADLVRERRDGYDPEAVGRDAEPEKPLVQDPVLARALDVLKGLAVVRQMRS